jgi:hypothetical protein
VAFDPDYPSEATVAEFSLMTHEPGALERYWRLAVETSSYQKRLQEIGIINSRMWVSVDYSRPIISYLLTQIPEEHHDSDLFSRWDEWAKEYDAIYQASPKWRLKKMISQISESYAACSWPNRWEQEIWNWAMLDSDAEAVCSFNRTETFGPEFRQRLRTLIEEVDGFLYRCEETHHIVFVPTESLKRIWHHQDHLAEIDRNKLFGFFYDASRPNYQMRAPTEQEEQMMAIMRRRSFARKGWRARVTHILKSMRGRPGT